MSKCISRHGEFSEHTLDADHVCTLCLVLDEDALIEELRQARESVASLTAENERLQQSAGDADATYEQLSAEFVKACAERDELAARERVQTASDKLEIVHRVLATLRTENERLRKERDEARATKDMHKERQQEAELALSSLRELESAARALLAFYDVWEHQIATYDPGDELISDGVRLTNISALVDVENYQLLEDAADRIVVQEAEIRAMLAALPPIPPATEGSA